MKTNKYTRSILISVALVLKCSLYISAQTQISILTHGPGEELYTAFGHSAIRIQDSLQNLDKVYNFGVFDFNDPGFLKNFVMGHTEYYLDSDPMERYLAQYVRAGRYTHEQILDIDSAQTQKIHAALMENAKEENKYYHYDFLADNCSSRILDVLMENIPNLEITHHINKDELSYAKIVDREYKRQHKLWTALGVKIMFGQKTSKVPNSKEMSFLPEKLESILGKASVNGKPLVRTMNFLSTDNIEFSPLAWYQRPSLIFTLIAAILFIAMLRSKYKKWIFHTAYIILGILGLFLLCMWLFTDQIYIKYNINLLWANPLFLYLPFMKDNKHHWYRTFLSHGLFLVMVLQLFLNEPFPNEIIPLVFVLWISLFRWIRFLFAPNSGLAKVWKR